MTYYPVLKGAAGIASASRIGTYVSYLSPLIPIGLGIFGLYILLKPRKSDKKSGLESKVAKVKVPDIWSVETEEIKDSNTNPRSPSFDELLRTEII